jgi:hypothetical protein
MIRGGFADATWQPDISADISVRKHLTNHNGFLLRFWNETHSEIVFVSSSRNMAFRRVHDVEP